MRITAIMPTPTPGDVLYVAAVTPPSTRFPAAGADLRPAPAGAAAIVTERLRAFSEEGHTLEHDDGHDGGELAWAAACYAAPDRIYRAPVEYAASLCFEDPWPWREDEDARRNGNVPDRTTYQHGVGDVPQTTEARIRELAKAGQLIAAEIDRLQRLLLDRESGRTRKPL